MKCSRGKSYFEGDRTQNYLLFQSVFKYFETVTNNGKVIVWKSKGFSEESIKPPTASDNKLNLGINYINNAKIPIKFDGSC